MLDPDFITESEDAFKQFMRLPIIEAVHDSGVMVFEHDYKSEYPEKIFCSHFQMNGRPICVPSEESYHKGQKIRPNWSWCNSCLNGQLFFAEGLTSFVPDLGDWVPLGIFETGTPILLSSPNTTK